MKTSTDPRNINPQYVQFVLDNLDPMQPFTVIFEKVDGTQRKLTGYLDPNNHSRKQAVPVMTDDGWRSFKLDHVLYISPLSPNTINQDW